MPSHHGGHRAGTNPRQFLSAVRSATGDLHQTLEENLSLQRITASREAYAATLREFFAIWAPLEAALARSEIAADPELDLEARLRAPKLEADLLALGVEGTALGAVPKARLPGAQPLTAAQAAGTLYVLEGSTLGGAVILRQAETNLGITARSGGMFFAGHGDRNAEMWKAFLAWAERAVAREGLDEAAAAARETFLLFTERFDEAASAAGSTG